MRDIAELAASAGFLARISAALFDGAIWILISVPAIVAIGSMSPARAETASRLYFFVALVAWWIYSAGYESSAKQATPGKVLVGIAVTDACGERLSFVKATGRFFAKFLTIVLFPLGLLSGLTIAVANKKQGLHDFAVGSLVLRTSSQEAERSDSGVQ